MYVHMYEPWKPSNKVPLNDRSQTNFRLFFDEEKYIPSHLRTKIIISLSETAFINMAPIFFNLKNYHQEISPYF